jgi:transcriptional regulator with XRE-family HTH domain
MMRSIRMGEEATLKDYSDLLDVSVQHLSDIENNRRVVSPERAAKFAKLLGYHEAQFVEMAIQEQLNHVGLEKFKVNVS